MSDTPAILIVGAADTGRAPLAVAILQRLLLRRGLAWPVASAGVVGHDEAPAQPEARDAGAALGLDIGEHRARSLDDAMVAQAALLIAVDRGVARVLRERHPAAQTLALGELAGTRRDIPDPFRMQVGAWITYAQEIEAMLRSGMDRLVALLQPEVGSRKSEGGSQKAEVSDAVLEQGPGGGAPAPGGGAQGAAAASEYGPGGEAQGPGGEAQGPGGEVPAPGAASGYGPGGEVQGPGGGASGPALPRTGALYAPASPPPDLARIDRLLALRAELPQVIDWEGARRQIGADLDVIAARAGGPLDRPYLALLAALLSLSGDSPTPAQLAALRGAVARLARPIDHAALAEVSALITREFAG